MSTTELEPLVQTDGRSRLVLPGHPNQRYLLREHDDGSILLQPAVVTNAAQHAYDTDATFRSMVDEAAASEHTPRELRRRRRAA